jgi:hypothetical protein
MSCFAILLQRNRIAKQKRVTLHPVLSDHSGTTLLVHQYLSQQSKKEKKERKRERKKERKKERKRERKKERKKERR